MSLLLLLLLFSLSFSFMLLFREGGECGRGGFCLEGVSQWVLGFEEGEV